MNAVMASLLARAAFMHHANPAGMYQPDSGIVTHECSTDELLTGAAFMHLTDKGRSTLKHSAVLTGLEEPDPHTSPPPFRFWIPSAQ